MGTRGLEARAQAQTAKVERTDVPRFCIVISNPTTVKHSAYDVPQHLPIISIVFLDENNKVKLGDFGLSKALSQASFAQTYVGVSTLT